MSKITERALDVAAGVHGGYMDPTQKNAVLAAVNVALTHRVPATSEVEAAIERIERAQCEGHFTHPDIVSLVNYIKAGTPKPPTASEEELVKLVRRTMNDAARAYGTLGTSVTLTTSRVTWACRAIVKALKDAGYIR